MLDRLSFDVKLATQIGLGPAIILTHFRYWTNYNALQEDMCKDGRVWLFASRKKIIEEFPFLSKQKVRTAIDKLIEGGWLIKGDYNRHLKNRSCWYALSDKALSFFQVTLVKSTDALVKITNDIINNKDNNIQKEENNNFVIKEERVSFSEGTEDKPLNTPTGSAKKDKVAPEDIIEAKRAKFKAECEPFVEKYGRKLIDKFIFYWTEANGTRLRWEIAKAKAGTFEISRRLATWVGKDYNKPLIPKLKAQRPIWEVWGITKEQYDEFMKTQK